MDKCPFFKITIISLFLHSSGTGLVRRGRALFSVLVQEKYFCRYRENCAMLLFLTWVVGNERHYPHTFQDSQNMWILFLNNELNIGYICLEQIFICR